MPAIIDGTLGITTPTYGGADTSEYLVPVTGFKNRIINGAMMIDQRNAGASVTPPNNGAFNYTLDRWSFFVNQTSKLTAQQVSDAPAGFTKSLKVTSSSAYSITSTDIFSVREAIEGLNFADFGYGTASAATFTLSFWVKSSLTGTFGGGLQNNAGNRGYAFTYIISAANTWEYKTVTVTGDTTGTWTTDTSIGLGVVWGLGVGSTNSVTAGTWGANSYTNSATGAVSVVGTNAATWQVTGIQLEKGTTATSFDYRPYTTELQLCQRYYEKSFAIGTTPANNIGSATGDVILSVNTTVGNSYPSTVSFKVTKRTTATVTLYNRQNASNDWAWYIAAGTATNGGVVDSSSDNGFSTRFQSVTTFTIVAGHWTASAEL